VLQAKATGKLLRYIAATGETHALANGIWYANGVALSADESFVAVVETSRTRVLRHWLKGPQVS
jgi:sugar lactone lactonase YvrE